LIGREKGRVIDCGIVASSNRCQNSEVPEFHGLESLNPTPRVSVPHLLQGNNLWYSCVEFNANIVGISTNDLEELNHSNQFRIEK
jgi:hypothetical protein